MFVNVSWSGVKGNLLAAWSGEAIEPRKARKQAAKDVENSPGWRGKNSSRAQSTP